MEIFGWAFAKNRWGDEGTSHLMVCRPGRQTWSAACGARPYTFGGLGSSSSRVCRTCERLAQDIASRTGV
jgi:hypothetical protein